MKHARGSAIAVAIGTATVTALLAGGAPAHAQVVDQSLNTGAFNATVGDTTAHVYPQISGSHKASYAMVTGGTLSAQARAQCQRRDGRTNWYQSTIRRRRNSGNSHYDCDNNGTYDTAIVGIGVDIN